MHEELVRLFDLGSPEQNEVLEAALGEVVGTNPEAAAFFPKWRRGADVSEAMWTGTDDAALAARDSIVRQAKQFVASDSWEPFVEETFGSSRGRRAILSIYCAGLLALSHEVQERKGFTDELSEEVGRLVGEATQNPVEAIKFVLAVAALSAALYGAFTSAGGVSAMGTVNLGSALREAYDEWKTTRLGRLAGDLVEGVLTRMYGSVQAAFANYTDPDNDDNRDPGSYTFTTSGQVGTYIARAKDQVRSHLVSLLTVAYYRGGKFYTLADGQESQAARIFPGIQPAVYTDSGEEFTADGEAEREPRRGATSTESGVAPPAGRRPSPARQEVGPSVSDGGDGLDGAPSDGEGDGPMGYGGGGPARADSAGASAAEVGAVGAYFGMTATAWKSCLRLMLRVGMVQPTAAIREYLA